MAGTTSYSQVGEDLIAAYLLGGAQNITYVDVGCLWPIKLSNTYYFYERGGRGLCIDPNPVVGVEFKEKRPEDCFLNIGVGPSDGELAYFMFDNPVFNTFSQSRSEKLALNPRRQIREVRPVKVKRLGDVIVEHGFHTREVDLLSMDIEGFEMEVLPTVDWNIFSPRLIVCESFQAGKSLADNKIAAFFADKNYSIAAYTGHDLFLRRRK